MNILNFLRKISFWTLDSIKGGYIRKRYMEIKKIDSMDSDDSYINDRNLESWIKLRDIATSETNFYKDYSGVDFFDFPIITKNDIRYNQKDFISNKYSLDNLITMSTSGSTGTPFICYQNIDKKKNVNAEIIYYSEKVGYKLGDNLSYIRTIVKQNKKSFLKQFLQNQTLINCGKLSDKGIELLLKKIKGKKGNVTLLAYGSTYKAISDYANRHDINILENFNVTGVISGSDMLFDETRDVIGRIFKDAKVVSRYSNEENGVLGQDEGLNNVFAINEANYIIEIVDDDGNVLPNGVLGRIVVTDLYNYAMPMIRYDTGDIGAIKVFGLNGRKKRCICEFSGRKVDVIFNTEDEAISPHIITNYMWNYPEVKQFQIIQKSKKHYELKLNIPENYSKKLEIVEMLKDLLGNDALIDLYIVDEIPVLSSGKRRYIVNEYINNINI